MMTKFESRFMRVATIEEPCQMSEDELKEEFERFQKQAIDLLMSDAGYLAIDFTLNALADGVTDKTCKIGSTNLGKLTEEQKAIATNKGWTLA